MRSRETEITPSPSSSSSMLPPTILPMLLVVMMMASGAAALPQTATGPIAGTSCQGTPYTGTLCKAYVNYPVALPPSTLDTVEKALAADFQLATKAFGAFPNCFPALAAQACASVFPACVNGNTQIACESSCKAFYDTCAKDSAPTSLLDLKFYACKQLTAADTEPLGADGSCLDSRTLIPSTGGGGSGGNTTTGSVGGGAGSTPKPAAKSGCSLGPPFIAPPPGVNISGIKTCDTTFNCCLPCPSVGYFYHQGDFDIVTQFHNYAALVSTLMTAFVVLSWLVLPGRKEHPGDIILHFAIAVMCWQGSYLLTLGSQARVVCADEVTTASASNSNICAFQGIVAMIAINATNLWCFYMVSNLHAVIVWRSSIFQRIKPFAVIFNWTVSAVVAFIPFAISTVNGDSAILCLVAAKDINVLMFSWHGALFGTSLLLVFLTVVHVFAITSRAAKSGSSSELSGNHSSNGKDPGVSNKPLSPRKQLMLAIWANWRPLTISACFTTVYTVYVIQSNIVLQPFAKLDPVNTEWVVKWKACMAFNSTVPGIIVQNVCHDLFTSNIPPLSMYILAAALTASVGLWIFAVFAWNMQIVRDWRAFFTGN